MFPRATLLLVAALPALTGVWCGEAVSVVGAQPRFVGEQHTRVVAPLGHAATLSCTVLALLDKSVSWVRSRDLQILSHAGQVFTADTRVSVAAAAVAGGASRHTLHIERLRASDSGRYECQVNTEPKMSLLFNLTVVDEAVPRVVVAAEGGAGAAGGAAALRCVARLQPAPLRLEPPPLDVRWYRHGEPIDLQSPRGGVSLETERWAARVVSRLTLAELAARDAGEYECAAADQRATAYLQVLPYPDELSAEAMQRDEARGAAAAWARSRWRAAAAALAPPAALLLLLR